MSTWIDFSIYAASNVVLWVILPLAYRQLTVPSLMDRNPEWVAANPELVTRMERSFWFNDACIAWGAFSIVVLLLIQLGVHLPSVPGTMSHDRPWERLSGANNTLFTAGLMGFGTVVFFAQRWLNRNVPPSVRRSAILRPRSAADSVPQVWRVATEILTVMHLAAWIVVGALGLSKSPKHWGGFIFVLFMTLVFAVMAKGSASRPTSFMDRLYGPKYRHREVRVIYSLRLAIVVFGAIALTGGVFGPAAMPIDPVRLSFLLFQIVFGGSLLAFLLIKPLGTALSPPSPAAAPPASLS